MLAGFGIADITPYGKCELNGFGMREQPALGVHKALKARALLMVEGRTQSLIAVCDLLGFSLADSRRLETAMARAAQIPVKDVMLTCTHTHSAPMSMGLGMIGQYDTTYMKQVRRQLIKAATQARHDLIPVDRFRWGNRRTSGMGFFRCAADEPGRDIWNGRLSALEFRRKGGPAIGVLSIGIHALVFGPDNRYVHPDYPGSTCDLWEQKTGGHALFLAGCGADVHPARCWVGSHDTRAVQKCAEEIVSLARRALKQGQTLPLLPFQTRRITPTVRYSFQGPIPRPDVPRWKKEIARWQRGLARGRWPQCSPFPIHILRIGPVALVGLPAEIFHDTGEDLARALPQVKLMTLSQAGGNVGYLPRRFAYRRLTYEAASAHIGYGKAGAMPPGTEKRIRDRVVSALNTLTAKTCNTKQKNIKTRGDSPEARSPEDIKRV